MTSCGMRLSKRSQNSPRPLSGSSGKQAVVSRSGSIQLRAPRTGRASRGMPTQLARACIGSMSPTSKGFLRASDARAIIGSAGALGMTHDEGHVERARRAVARTSAVGARDIPEARACTSLHRPDECYVTGIPFDKLRACLARQLRLSDHGLCGRARNGHGECHVERARRAVARTSAVGARDIPVAQACTSLHRLDERSATRMPFIAAPATMIS